MTRPQAPGFGKTFAATSSSSAWSARRMLRKPGGAATSRTRTGCLPIAGDPSVSSAARMEAIRQGRHAVRPGELHRQVAGEVAVLGIRRPLDLDRWSWRHPPASPEARRAPWTGPRRAMTSRTRRGDRGGRHVGRVSRRGCRSAAPIVAGRSPGPPYAGPPGPPFGAITQQDRAAACGVRLGSL